MGGLLLCHRCHQVPEINCLFFSGLFDSLLDSVLGILVHIHNTYCTTDHSDGFTLIWWMVQPELVGGLVAPGLQPPSRPS